MGSHSPHIHTTPLHVFTEDTPHQWIDCNYCPFRCCMDLFFHAFSSALAAIPSWPVLACIHYYVTAIALRNEPGK